MAEDIPRAHMVGSTSPEQPPSADLSGEDLSTLLLALAIFLVSFVIIYAGAISLVKEHMPDLTYSAFERACNTIASKAKATILSYAQQLRAKLERIHLFALLYCAAFLSALTFYRAINTRHWPTEADPKPPQETQPHNPNPPRQCSTARFWEDRTFILEKIIQSQYRTLDKRTQQIQSLEQTAHDTSEQHAEGLRAANRAHRNELRDLDERNAGLEARLRASERTVKNLTKANAMLGNIVRDVEAAFSECAVLVSSTGRIARSLRLDGDGTRLAEVGAA